MTPSRKTVDRVVEPSRLAEWHRLLSQQHGVACLDQLREFGVTWSAVVAHLDAGRWQRVLPRV
jgi:hypothetical protein